ncbi:gliding motility-related protein [Flavobacterium limnosediminis JC2902]|uniref:Gliding motility-related protein n=1 Tax=Flavobacterium limnosediminis JC2902 TaxID=1341181 RepID=V6SPD1_9FLAO|nr:outer membrane lipoprotein carrier protein LolA [Flavobacterium limnosediminis]ESU28294.1 gliding motility-related protein [Flavobacterium limnosediminis JC2902]
MKSITHNNSFPFPGKNLIALLFALFLYLPGSAQNSQKAKELLDDVTAKVKSYDNIVINFSYSVQNLKQNIDQDSKGNVTLKGNQYVLNFMGVTKIFDGKKNYTIVPEDQEITISKHDDNDANALTPAKMLTFFNSGFKYSWDILQNIKGRQIQYVKLIPTNTKDNRKEILLGIDAQTKNIYNLIEMNKNGSKTTIVVNSFKTNQPISKNHFTFTQSKYPNYYINNLD